MAKQQAESSWENLQVITSSQLRHERGRGQLYHISPTRHLPQLKAFWGHEGPASGVGGFNPQPQRQEQVAAPLRLGVRECFYTSEFGEERR